MDLVLLLFAQEHLIHSRVWKPLSRAFIRNSSCILEPSEDISSLLYYTPSPVLDLSTGAEMGSHQCIKCPVIVTGFPANIAHN